MAVYQWMSFRDPEKNLNLGVCIIKALTLHDAIDQAWLTGLNPGGEIEGIQLTQDEFNNEGLECNRLYTKQEMIELGYTNQKGYQA